MKPGEAGLAPHASLFETFAPVERYFREVQARAGAGPAPAPPVKLRAEDAYLMHLLAGMHPRIQAVLDLAGPSTWGATTVFWSARPPGPHVHALVPSAEGPEIAWHSVLRERLGAQSNGDHVTYFFPGDGTANLPALLARCGCSAQPTLVTVALTGHESAATIDSLDRLFTFQAESLVLTLPVGPAGEDPHLEELLAWTRTKGLRFLALRDLSPFLAGSRMALIHASCDESVAEVLKRIQRFFSGNFEFLSLASQLHQVSYSGAEFERRFKETDAQLAQTNQQRQQAEAQLAQVTSQLQQAETGLREAVAQFDLKRMQAEVRQHELLCAQHADFVGKLREADARLAQVDVHRQQTEAQLGHVSNQLQQTQAQLGQSEISLREWQTQLEAQRQQTEVKEQAIIHLTHEISHLTRALRACETDCGAGQRRVVELEQANQVWATEFGSLLCHHRQLEAQLNSITQARSWRLVQRLRRLRYRLAPPESWRERCGRALMRWQRRLRTLGPTRSPEV